MPGAAHVDLPIAGMACASCAARIEKKLDRLDDAHAPAPAQADLGRPRRSRSSHGGA